ncbi:MAG: helix-turn-helix domain-containing protein [Lachnospiraceae bacterium]|nr:helix-turn-helix domain-containing protein [Lachnospiraceae bacterium]
MDKQTKLGTEEILKEIENGNTVNTNNIDFIKRDEQLIQLSRKIMEEYGSYSKFATASDVSPSHLNEFLNGKKQLGRDKLICICIALKYTIKEARQALRCLGNTDLYSKNRRDFEILNCIQQGKSLDETNEILQKKKFETLSEKRNQP